MLEEMKKIVAETGVTLCDGWLASH